jgi:hypothetical protein
MEISVELTGSREGCVWNGFTELSVELTGCRDGTALNGVKELSVEITGCREDTVWNGVTELSSSSIGTTTLSWVSACSTIGEHSQQGGFTECRCQRHVKPPTWRTKDLERSNFRHKRPPASEATLANTAARNGREFCRKWRLPRHFWVILHVVKHMGQTALLPLRRKAC